MTRKDPRPLIAAVPMPEDPSASPGLAHCALARRRLSLAGGLAVLGLVLPGCGGGGVESPAVAPGLDIRSDTVAEAKGPFTVTFYFRDAVLWPASGLAFALSGASVVAGSFQRLNDRTASVQLRPNANAQGLVELRVPAGAYTDATGTASNTQAVTFAQPFDTRAPLATLSFGGPVNPLGVITGGGVFTLRFSVVLDRPLAADALRVSVGLVSAFTRTSAAGEPDVYSFRYDPPRATLGQLLVELPPGVVSSGGIPNEADYWTFALQAG